uniref:(northern house mosquito) hypothetical protein n=1 Tax=Culex pipiens TaxID=7175 RepID=A0A8D8BK72_CULPI
MLQHRPISRLFRQSMHPTKPDYILGTVGCFFYREGSEVPRTVPRKRDKFQPIRSMKIRMAIGNVAEAAHRNMRGIVLLMLVVHLEEVQMSCMLLASSTETSSESTADQRGRLG